MTPEQAVFSLSLCVVCMYVWRMHEYVCGVGVLLG